LALVRAARYDPANHFVLVDLHSGVAPHVGVRLACEDVRQLVDRVVMTAGSVTATLFLIGGVQARYLVALVVSGFVGVIAALQMEVIQVYQLSRLTAFLGASDPALAQGGAYQTRQSLIAIGSGQFSGKGLFEGTQTALAYVPENHTDFIFTVIGEEFGFVGTSFVLAVFLLLIWRALRIAVVAKDLFGTLVAGGIASVLALQVVINVGMTIGIMPVTGLPLPFISYGGTSLIVWFAMIGLLLNIHMRRF
jgi:rod shape determining protein RodA